MGKTIPVMIVDDEILAVEDLQNLIPWGQYGFEIVATATNSQKALDLYQKYHPRILFVDIRMPVMDGLELSRRVRLLGNPVKIVLLTAFKDFDYAKQALEIGVANYLLKHDINEASLLRELAKLKSELQNEARQNSILRQQCLRKILLHSEAPEVKTGFAGFKLPELIQYNLGLILITRDSPYLEEFQTYHQDSPIGMLDLENTELPEGIDWIEGVDLDSSQFHEYNAGLIIDESGVVKKGKNSVGVARQWIGNIGKVENGQVGVYGSLVNGEHRTIVDARLYLAGYS